MVLRYSSGTVSTSHSCCSAAMMRWTASTNAITTTARPPPPPHGQPRAAHARPPAGYAAPPDTVGRFGLKYCEPLCEGRGEQSREHNAEPKQCASNIRLRVALHPGRELSQSAVGSTVLLDDGRIGDSQDRNGHQGWPNQRLNVTLDPRRHQLSSLARSTLRRLLKCLLGLKLIPGKRESPNAVDRKLPGRAKSSAGHLRHRPFVSHGSTADNGGRLKRFVSTRGW